MQKPNAIDPYVYPSTTTLINKFNIKDSSKLQVLEGIYFALKNSEPLPPGNYDYAHLKAIHHHFFSDLYEWAGEERTIDIAKSDSYFAHTDFISSSLNKLFTQLKKESFLQNLPLNEFCKKLSFYFNEINAVHPFREGNGRTQRAFCDQLAEQAGYILDWTLVSKEQYLKASIAGFLHGNYETMETVFLSIIIAIDQTQAINISENIVLSPETTLHMKKYIEQQIELTHLNQQKNNFLVSNPLLAKELGQQAIKLNKKIEASAKLLSSKSDALVFVRQPYITSLQKNGGFAAIYERMQNHEMSNKDILSVLRHAKSTSQRLLQTQQQSINRKNNSR